MTLIFKDALHDEFGTWPLAYIPYGGADFGELAAVARTVGDGDDSAFYQAWVAAADRMAVKGPVGGGDGGRRPGLLACPQFPRTRSAAGS